MKIDRVAPLLRANERVRRLLACSILSLFVAGSNWAIAMPAAAESPATCPTPGIGRAIGPHVSGDGSLNPGSPPVEWVGPCGSSDMTGSIKNDFDHFYVTLTQAADLEVRLSWPDDADNFTLQVYRGREEQFAASHPDCGMGASVGEPCLLAQSSALAPGVDGSVGERQLTLSHLLPGTYTVRALYTAVVESYYEGSVAASLPGEGIDPGEDPLPDLGPGSRGSYALEPNDEYFDEQWGLQQINAPRAWQERQATGHGITIAVLDTGLDVGHPDFHCAGKLVLPDGPLPWDRDGHGTHVAGIASACAANREGVAGVAPDAAIMPVKVEGAITFALLDENMARAVDAAVDDGAHVINLSFGPTPPDSHLPPEHAYPKTEAALERARAAGVVVAAAAGNYSQPMCEYPSRSPSVICVGATDSERNVTAYGDLPNNVNLDEDGATFGPSVVAPGGAGRQCNRNPLSGEMIFTRGIVSTDIRTLGDERCGYPNGYSERNGTSMASPYVAGVAALVYDRLGGKRTAENADRVVQAIIETAADDLYAPGYDAFSGYGLVDAWAAVTSIAVPEEKQTDPTPGPDGDPGPNPGPQDPGPDPSEDAALPHTAVLSPRDARGEVGTETDIVLTVTDEEGSPVAGTSIEWASVGVGAIVQAEAVTDETGRATARLVSDQPGDQHVMAWTTSCAEEGDCVDEAIRHHGPERCDIFGTVADDVLRGTDAAEVICGFGGNDVVSAGAGNDVVFVHGGDDRVEGAVGDDRLHGGDGKDQLAGGRGADLLIGGRDVDVMDGGRGIDTCHGSSGERLTSCRG